MSKIVFSEKVSIWLLEVPRGVSNHSGGQLGPPEVIFDLKKKIDFLKFFGFFKIFCPLELVCKISVFGPQTHQKWIKPARPNTFWHPGDRGSTWEAWLATIGPVSDPVAPVYCKIQTIAYGGILEAMPPGPGRFSKWSPRDRDFLICASKWTYQGPSLTKIWNWANQGIFRTGSTT